MKEVIFKFTDGDYTVRPYGIGDTVMGPTAHNIMWAMCRQFGYTARIEIETKVIFIANYKTDGKA